MSFSKKKSARRTKRRRVAIRPSSFDTMNANEKSLDSLNELKEKLWPIIKSYNLNDKDTQTLTKELEDLANLIIDNYQTEHPS